MEQLKKDCINYRRRWQRNFTEFSIVHEAGHMTIAELWHMPSYYGWTGNVPCVWSQHGGDYPVLDAILTMGGDVANFIVLGYPDIEEMCVGLYRYEGIRDRECDWSLLRDRHLDEEQVYVFATVTKMKLLENWDAYINNYRLAQIYYEMPMRSWQVHDLLTSGDTLSIYKVFGFDANPEELLEKLFDPATSLDTMKRIGRQ